MVSTLLRMERTQVLLQHQLDTFAPCRLARDIWLVKSRILVFLRATVPPNAAFARERFVPWHCGSLCSPDFC
jgi:hypothetical protein